MERKIDETTAQDRVRDAVGMLAEAKLQEGATGEPVGQLLDAFQKCRGVAPTEESARKTVREALSSLEADAALTEDKAQLAEALASMLSAGSADTDPELRKVLGRAALASDWLRLETALQKPATADDRERVQELWIKANAKRAETVEMLGLSTEAHANKVQEVFSQHCCLVSVAGPIRGRPERSCCFAGRWHRPEKGARRGKGWPIDPKGE